MPPRISDNYEEWSCPTCGAPVRSTVEACPFCGTTADGVVPPTFFAVLGRFLGGVLLICLGWTAFFALCGFVCALITGDWKFMAALTIFGVIAGVLFGIGGQVIQAVRDRQEPLEEEPQEMPNAALLAGHVMAAVLPVLKPFVLVAAALNWIANKDFRRQSSGRGKRAMVGAIILGLLGIAMLSFARLVIGPPPPGGMTFGEAVVLILVLSVIGAVLGLLSDRF